jgi:hypothetical protein
MDRFQKKKDILQHIWEAQGMLQLARERVDTAGNDWEFEEATDLVEIAEERLRYCREVYGNL